ncbi:MAG: hypothetical protein V3U64_03415 [Cocleimonas sp.]
MDSIYLMINPKVLEKIYEVPLGLSSWNDVAIALQDDFRANLGVFFLSPYVPQSELSFNVSEMWDAFEQHHLRSDVIQIDSALAISDWVGNSLSKDEFFISSKTFDTAGSFKKYWKSENLSHTMGTIISTSNGVNMQIGFPREKTAGAYTREETSNMKFYAENMRRALELEGVLGSSLPAPIYEHALAATFGLTGAETRMVMELFKSGSLPDAAKELNRSYHTVRNQMKSVLVKTGTSNQLKLMQCLMSHKRVKNPTKY